LSLYSVLEPLPHSAAVGSKLTQAVALLALPFGHEDAAILWGGYLVAQGLASLSFVAGTLYAGMLASDIAIFGIGVGARRVPWLQRFTRDPRLGPLGTKLQDNFLGLMILSRFVPGLLFPTLVACGWTGVSFRRFVGTAALISAVYLPLLLALAVAYGQTAWQLFGWWSWIGVVALFGLLAVGRMTLARALGPVGAKFAPAPPPADGASAAASHHGMPPLRRLAGQVALAERVPPLLFYLPLIANWIRLSVRYRSATLPSAANPLIPTGGMWGESKSACLDQIAPDQRAWVADYTVVRAGGGALHLALARLSERGIGFPLVAKPDVGWQGYGVCHLADASQLAAYLEGCLPGACVILQELVPDDGEAAVLYAQEPGSARGRILSLTLRYYAHVIGDGRASVRELIRRTPRGRWKDKLYRGRDDLHHGLSRTELERVPFAGEIVRLAFIGSARAGGLYRDISAQITPALDERFGAIASSMPEFHYGRFDLRFRSLQDLRDGVGFKIFEVNGVGGEAIEIWDPDRTLAAAYRTLFEQQELIFALGDRNRARGFEPEPLRPFLSALRLQTKLLRAYPRST
jgi:membrane protein DedA with SNARE-associated domain